MNHDDVLKAAGFGKADLESGTLAVVSPIDGSEVARLAQTDVSEMPEILERAQRAFMSWRTVPAPRRGELIRLWGEELRAARARYEGYWLFTDVTLSKFDVSGQLPSGPPTR